jgi:hypothetical protein
MFYFELCDLIWNTYVLFPSFGSGNVVSGMFDNAIFCTILFVTSVLQVLIVEFGGNALHVSDGLSGKFWAISLILGFGSIPVQQCINIIYNASVDSKRKWRQRRRYNRDRALVVQNSGNHPHTE